LPATTQIYGIFILQGILEQNNLELGFHQGFQFSMVKACIKACPFPFTSTFAKFFSPCNYFLQD
jgi:hypothetical protein